MKTKTQQYLILGVLFVSWIIGYFDKNAINVAAIQISQEFDLSPSQIGMIMSSFFISYSLMTLVGGILADKYGSRKVITTIMLLWSVFTALTGMAWSFASLVVLRLFLGLGESIAFPGSTKIFAAEVPAERRGIANAVVAAALAFVLLGIAAWWW